MSVYDVAPGIYDHYTRECSKCRAPQALFRKPKGSSQAGECVDCLARQERLAPKPESLDIIRAEVIAARTKFPKNTFLMTALTEEVGELAQALLQKKSRDEIIGEAKQVAAVAIRIIEEGDASFDNLTDAEAKP